MSPRTVLPALKAWFAKSGIPILDDESRSRELDLLRRRTGLDLPEDFARYLAELAPGDAVWDDETVHWWPPAKIQTLAEEYRHKIHLQDVSSARDQYLVFADMCGWAWAWAVACTHDRNRGRVFVMHGSEDGDRFVAESFDAFLKLYLRDPALVE